MVGGHVIYLFIILSTLLLDWDRIIGNHNFLKSLNLEEHDSLHVTDPEKLKELQT